MPSIVSSQHLVVKGILPLDVEVLLGYRDLMIDRPILSHRLSKASKLAAIAVMVTPYLLFLNVISFIISSFSPVGTHRPAYIIDLFSMLCTQQPCEVG